MKNTLPVAYFLLACLLLPIAVAAQTSASRMVARSSYFYQPYPHLSLADSTHYTFVSPNSALWAAGYQYRMVPPASVWTPGQQQGYTYDGSGNITRLEYLKWNGSGYLPVQQLLRSYNAAGYMRHQLMQTWDTGSKTYVNLVQDSFTYNSANDKMRHEWEGWDKTTAAWIRAGDSVISRNAQHNITELLISRWSSAINMIDTNSLVVLRYDATGLLMESETSYVWNSGNHSWVYSKSDTLFYNASGQLRSQLFYQWNTNSQKPDTSTRYYYTYDALTGYLSSSLRMIWSASSGALDSFSQEDYSYDATGKLTDKVTTTWLPAGPAKTNRTTNTYNSFDQLTNSTDYTWDVLNGNWRPTVVRNYYYETYTPLSIAKGAAGKLQLIVSPNPATTYLDIRISAERGQGLAITLSDLEGRVKQQLNGIVDSDLHTRINTASLPAGNYLLSVRSADGGSSARLVTVIH
jgi:hypothetical protein